jgi:hypothetical protein
LSMRGDDGIIKRSVGMIDGPLQRVLIIFLGWVLRWNGIWKSLNHWVS